MAEFGDNSHGFRNEQNLVNAINGCKLDGPQNNVKKFVEFIIDKLDIPRDEVKSLKAVNETDTKLKEDLYIFLNGKPIGISTKLGSGNSVHQEKCEDFVNYIKTKCHASDTICDDFRLYLWADGTIDGSGSIEKDENGNIKCRFTATQFRNLYPEKFTEMQNFLDNNKMQLIRYFMFTGRHNSHVDFLYHGDVQNAVWLYADDAVEKASRGGENSKSLHTGALHLQSWNISLKGNTEKKRGQLQVKYPNMKQDLLEMMRENAEYVGTDIGDLEEFNITSEFNKYKNQKAWEELLRATEISNNDDIYMVKVTKKVYSKLSNTKTLPKSDAYLIQCQLDNDYLLSKEFKLSEDDLEDKNYKVIKGSGISVKLRESTSYTIQKLTHGSFNKAFNGLLDNPNTIFWGLLVYSNDAELKNNFIMLDDLELNKDDVVTYFEKCLGQKICLENTKDISEIRKYCQNKTKEAIVKNSNLYSSIFTGSGWFEEPYVAHFIYLNNKIHINNLEDFTITSGSGRHKKKYSISIKPIYNGK